MADTEAIPYGTAYLYCSQCKSTTTVRWTGKLTTKRCWRCDTLLEERDGSGS